MSWSFGSLVKTENFVSDIRSLMNMIYREIATVKLLFENFFYLNFGLNSVVNNLFDSYCALLIYCCYSSDISWVIHCIKIVQ
jgi:hypothetical protein